MTVILLLLLIILYFDKNIVMKVIINGRPNPKIVLANDKTPFASVGKILTKKT